MEKIKVKYLDSFLDGGTDHYVDENGNDYYEDHRIRTLTPGVIYDRYPKDRDAKILNIELIKE